MGELGRHRVVGIAALVDALRNHWGAVGRDLAAYGYTWDDVGSERLPIGQFVSFVAYSPPGTALFHQRNKGWTTGDHLLAQAVDALNMLAWFYSADSRKKVPKHRPEPTPRPGMQVRPQQQQSPSSGPPNVMEPKVMTVAEYLERTGLKGVNLGEEGTK